MDKSSPPPDAAAPALDHVECWLFDLDNTLYPSSCDLFSQVDVRIGQYVADLLKVSYDEAKRLQKSHFRQYGTTMNGLMTEHGIDPHHYLSYVHAIDHSPVCAAPRLDAALAALPGRKYVFTNASVPHAEKVLDRVGIGHHFGGIFDIVASGFRPKPAEQFYDGCIARYGIEPARTVLFDDMAKNLKPAHARGMTTVLIEGDDAFYMAGHDEGHVHHRTRDLCTWLEGVLAARAMRAAPPR